MLSSFVKRAVGSYADETPPHTRGAQTEDEDDDGQYEEEYDKQSHPDRVRLWTERALEGSTRGQTWTVFQSIVPAAAEAGPLSTLPPRPAYLQSGGAQPTSQ